MCYFLFYFTFLLHALNKFVINVAFHLSYDSHSSTALAKITHKFIVLEEFQGFNGVSSPTRPCSHLCKLAFQNYKDHVCFKINIYLSMQLI